MTTLSDALNLAINNPTYINQFGIGMRIIETAAQFKAWVNFFKKYSPKLNRNGELDVLIRNADNVVDSYNSLFVSKNMQGQNEAYQASWLNGTFTDAQNLYFGLVNVLTPLYNYAVGQAGANLVLIEARKAQLKMLLASTNPFDDLYAKYKEESDAYDAISQRLGKVSFELEGILSKEIYDKYYIAPAPVAPTTVAPTTVAPTSVAPAPVAPTTVVEAVAAAPVVTVNPANGIVSKVETKEITPGISVPTFTPVATLPMEVLESKGAGAVASEINANVKTIIAENTANSTNTANTVDNSTTRNVSNVENIRTSSTVENVANTSQNSPQAIPLSMGVSLANPNSPAAQMQMNMTATGSTNGSTSTEPEVEEVKPLWKQLWEKYKLWIIVGAVIVLGLLAFWIWYMIDSDKDREEARVQKLKLKLKKQEGQLED